MRDKLWVTLKPHVPDCDVIAKHFFKAGKKGTQTFKSGKTIIHFHVPNEIYDAMLENLRKETVESSAQRTMNGTADRKVAANFTVGVLRLQTIMLVLK